MWSDPVSWGGDFPPFENESVHIPKGVSVLVDMDPPKLNAVIVEGSLIFASDDFNPNH